MPALQGSLSVSFTQPTYRLGEPLEFNATLVHNETAPQATTISLYLTADYESWLPVADGVSFEPVWSETRQETLEDGKPWVFSYQIPYAVYAEIGTGYYELKIEAGQLNAVATATVISVFDVELTCSGQLQAGQEASVQATVTNVADRDAHNVTVSGSIVGMSEQMLDTLPAQHIKTVTWTVIVPDVDVFAPAIFVASSDGGNTTVSAPSIPITPVATP